MRTQPTPSAASSIASNSYPSRSTPFSRTAATTKSASFDVLGPLPGGSPGHQKGKRLLHQLDTHASYWTEYAMYKGKDRELQFPHAVCVSYHNGDRGENGEVVRGYVACDLTDRTPKQVETLYRKRSAIETSYRTYREARATTTTPDPLIRFVLVAVGFLLRNLWLVVRWTVVARPRRGGRDLPTEFTFELVCGWIRDHLSTELGWQYTWETNGVGLPPGYALATA